MKQSIPNWNHKESQKEKGRGNYPEPERVDWFKENRDPRFHSYTSLTVPRGKILDEALQVKLIPPLKPSQTPKNANTSTHCQYHRNYDYSTKGCQALKDKVEELVQVGHFHKFVKIDVAVHRSPQRNQQSSRGPRYYNDRSSQGDGRR